MDRASHWGKFAAILFAEFLIAVLVAWGPWAVFHLVFGIPDLSRSRAAELIVRAPEFNRYARLVKVESIAHLRGSEDSLSNGVFTFRYLNSPANVPTIRANAEFRYSEGAWHFNEFDYVCPSVKIDNCRIVDIDNEPPKHR